MRPLLLLLPLLLCPLSQADDPVPEGPPAPPAGPDPPVGPDPPSGPDTPEEPEDPEDPEETKDPVPRFPIAEDFRDMHVISRFVHNDNVTIRHYEEFFDFDTKRGRLDVMVEGIPNEIERVSTFYSKDSNQLIEIKTVKKNVSCTVATINLADVKPITDLTFVDANGTVICGPMAIWRWVAQRMNSEKPLIQLHGARGQLRGRSVWFYEFMDTEKEIDVNIIMYFIDSGGAVEIPIQFEIKGSQDGIIVVDKYEILLIEDYLNEDTEITPAIGAGCLGMKETDAFDKMLGKMTILSAETVELDVEIVEQVAEVNLQFSHNMIMSNHNHFLYMTDWEGDDEIGYIEDLERGVTYVQVNGEECGADPLESRFVSRRHSLSFAKGLKEILNLDGNFYFLGETAKRGLSVQVWERVVWDHRFTTFDESAEGLSPSACDSISPIPYLSAGVRYKKAVITQFLTNELDVDMGSSSILPVQTLLTGYGEDENGKLVKKFTQEINYFNVREVFVDDIRTEVLDVSNCFPDDKDRNHLDIFLRTEGHAAPNHSFALIERMVARQISEGAHISVLRIPRVEVSSAGHFSSKEGSGLVLNVLILEKPSLMFYFKNVSMSLKPHKGDEAVRVPLEECAGKAIQTNAQKSGSCSGFFYCGGTCYLTNWTLSDEGREEVEADPGKCTFFQRNVMNDKDLTAEPDLETVTKMLFGMTAAGELYFQLEGREGVSDTYTVSNVMVARPRQELVQSRAFAHTVPKYTLSESETTVTISGKSVGSIGDCEAACDQEAAMLCESFAFCKGAGAAGMCILSPNTVTAASSGIQASESCDIYTRTYRSLFVEVDGGIAPADSDQVREISDVEECARTCSSLTDFKCQSFAFCGTTHCVLKQAHAFTTNVSDAKEKQGDIECDLFTAKHFSDYVPTANVIVGGDALQKLEKLSTDECAAKCSAQSGCRSINYCHESARTPEATCSLMAVSPSDRGAERSRHPGCWNYRRVNVVNAPPTQKPAGPTGYMGARLTWLVIGMIITGAVLGIAGLLAYGHYRARAGHSPNGVLGLSIPSVRWSRQRDEE